ncbi:gliding motility-associated C-terminal domain-containing protein [Mucilaginibacter sp. HMF5004]|uniref:T9SS type B sorting domain-containing protein n=1 Tax=Mucilaginibacter rivuli TaxID=2857527 RepID=UPI001C5D559E|nr:gliding motility-associated C-terminal domain-containing protein [Mucilaginibacter rivuli]MBW4889458.1 gliding motility-associated C-terminal domain-containing protein [Mucilaginibacter rivuli]
MQKFNLLLLLFLLLPCAFAFGQILSPVWVNDIGGTGSASVVKIVTDSQDNIYVTGSFQGTIDLSPAATVTHQLTSKGNLDIFIAKYTGSGTLVWCKQLGDTGSDYPVSICLDDNNNVFVTGQFLSPYMDIDPGTNVTSLLNEGQKDIFVVKLNNAGNFLWGSQISGTGNQIVTSIKADHNNNVYICGSIDSKTRFGITSLLTPSAPVDGFIAKYNGNSVNNQSPIWVSHFGGTGTQNIAFGLAIDPNNEILITGRSNDIGVTADFIAKYATDGSIVWINRIQSNGTGTSAITTDLQGNVILSGYFSNQVVFDVSSPKGTVKASNNTATDSFVAQYSGSGKFGWAIGFGQAGTNTYALDVITDNKSNVYVGGWFNGNPNFNPATGKPVLIQPYGGYNAFAVKYSRTGQYVCAANIGTAQTANIGFAGNGIALTTSNEILLAGAFNNTTDFNPGACTNNVTAQGISDGFIVKYSASPTPAITGLNLPQQKTMAVIDTVNRTVNIEVFSGTDLTKLSPIVTINNGTLTPSSGTAHDFSSPFIYHVTDGCTTYDYVVTVSMIQILEKANAGTDQSNCNNPVATLHANTPPAGGIGTWSVVVPAGYSPFDQSNINDPSAQIKNIPADTKVVLAWTVNYKAVQQTSADSVTIWNYSLPEIGTPKEYIISNPGSSVSLSPAIKSTGTLTYAWHPGTGLSDSTIVNPSASPIQTTSYKLIVTNANGCSTSATFKVIVAYSLVIPSVFTPNQDGINDTWTIKNIEAYQNCEVDIYDRSGQLIFNSKGYATPWAGTYKGKKLPTGSYYYVIRMNDKNKQTLSGTVTVMY